MNKPRILLGFFFCGTAYSTTILAVFGLCKAGFSEYEYLFLKKTNGNNTLLWTIKRVDEENNNREI